MNLENNQKGFSLTTTELKTIELEFQTTGLIITAIAGREFIEATFKTPYINDTYVPQFKTLTEGPRWIYSARYVSVNKILDANRLIGGELFLQKNNYLKKRHTTVSHYNHEIGVKLYIDNSRKRVDISINDKIEIRIKLIKYVRDNEIPIGEKKLVCDTISIPKTKT